MKQDARFFTYLLCAALAVYAFGRCEGRAVTEMGWHERNVQRVTSHVRGQRKALAAAIAAKDTTRRVVIVRSASVDAAQGALADVLLIAEAAIKDSAATIETLRRELGRTVAAANGLSLQVDSLQAAISRDAVLHLAERAANRSVIAAQDAVITAQAKHIKRLQCRVLGLRCPSRLQSLGLGALMGLAVVLL